MSLPLEIPQIFPLFDVRSTQRDALVGGLAVETVQWAKARGAGLVVEDLQFILLRPLINNDTRGLILIG